MNLRMKIVEQLMSSLFDREYLADCEDAALEIMKLILTPSAATKERSELSAKIIEFVDAFGEDVTAMSPAEIDQLSTWAVKLASLCSVNHVPSTDKE
jgi:hypothetical protein